MGYWGILNISHGLFRSVNAWDVVPASSTWTEIEKITEAGVLMWVRFAVQASAGSDHLAPRIQVDDVIIHPYETFESFTNDYGMIDSIQPITVTAHIADGRCSMTYNFIQGVRFDKSLLLEGWLSGGAGHANATLEVIAGYEARNI